MSIRRKPRDLGGVLLTASKYAEETDTDVLLFNSQFYPGGDAKLLQEMKGRSQRKKNVLLLIVSEGGNAEASYKIARTLQKSYEKVSAFVHGYCKSAGTLTVLGAHEVVMSDTGELGPLDVQVAKKDELGESNSGLITSEALRSLQAQAFDMYEDFFMKIIERSQRLVTFKTASDIAVRMSVGLLEPLYAQINPFQVGEMARSMRIARDYGARLGGHSGNLQDEGLELLCDTYPSHGFVIDREEAASLFKNIRLPTADEASIAEQLGPLATTPTGSIVKFLNLETQRSTHEAAPEATAPSPQRPGAPSPEASAGRSTKASPRRQRVPKGK